MGERAGEREEMEGKGWGERRRKRKGKGGGKIMGAGGGRERFLQILDQKSQVSSSFLSIVTQGSL